MEMPKVVWESFQKNTEDVPKPNIGSPLEQHTNSLLGFAWPHIIFAFNYSGYCACTYFRSHRTHFPGAPKSLSHVGSRQVWPQPLPSLLFHLRRYLAVRILLTPPTTPKMAAQHPQHHSASDPAVPVPTTDCPCCTPKNVRAYHMIRDDPGMWFRDTVIDDRDRALLSAERVSFVEYSQASYLRKIVRFSAHLVSLPRH